MRADHLDTTIASITNTHPSLFVSASSAEIMYIREIWNTATNASASVNLFNLKPIS